MPRGAQQHFKAGHQQLLAGFAPPCPSSPPGSSPGPAQLSSSTQHHCSNPQAEQKQLPGHATHISPGCRCSSTRAQSPHHPQGEPAKPLSLPAVWGVDLYNLIKPFRLPVNPMRLPRCTKGFPGWQPPPLPSVPGGATDSAQPIMILCHLIPFKHEVKISINLRAGF